MLRLHSRSFRRDPWNTDTARRLYQLRCCVATAQTSSAHGSAVGHTDWVPPGSADGRPALRLGVEQEGTAGGPQPSLR